MKYDKNFNQSREDQYMKSYYNNFIGQMQSSATSKVPDSLLGENLDLAPPKKDRHCASNHSGIVVKRDRHRDKENMEKPLGLRESRPQNAGNTAVGLRRSRRLKDRNHSADNMYFNEISVEKINTYFEGNMQALEKNIRGNKRHIESLISGTDQIIDSYRESRSKECSRTRASGLQNFGENSSLCPPNAGPLNSHRKTILEGSVHFDSNSKPTATHKPHQPSSSGLPSERHNYSQSVHNYQIRTQREKLVSSFTDNMASKSNQNHSQIQYNSHNSPHKPDANPYPKTDFDKLINLEYHRENNTNGLYQSI